MKKILLIGICSIICGQVDIYERKYQNDPEFNIDVNHYDIYLEIYDHIKSFSGEVEILFEIKKNDIQLIKFDIETIDVIKVYENNNPLKFIQKNGALYIEPSNPLLIGETLKYKIIYNSNGKIADPANYNMAGVKALGIQFFDETEDNPQLVQTHSFPTGARHWFPSNDHPFDKATSRIKTKVRKDWKVLSNGLLKEKNAIGDSTIFTWELNLPNSTYLYVMVAGPFEIIKDFHGKIPISYWVYPKDKQNAMISFKKTPEIISFFEKEYGVLFPWPKMDQITIPGIGGGAESTTATILGHNTIHDQKADKDFPSHWLVAHEAAHHWWGDYITMSNWHHAWLNESFGTYGEYLYSAHSKGYDEGLINLWKKKQGYLKEYRERYSRPMVHPYWDWPNQNFDSHIYSRGAAVLHMLRQVIGGKNMKKFQKIFLNKYAYKNPTTEDLFKVINETVGKNMDWFFDQWIMSAGHPKLNISTKWENNIVTINIDQTQQGRQVPSIYKLPIDIDIYHNNKIERKSTVIKKRNTVYQFKSKNKPSLIRIDPDNHLLIEISQKKSKEELLIQLKKDNVIGRYDAALSLKEFCSSINVINELKYSAFNDESWFVRKASLSILNTSVSKEEWIEAYNREKHSQPRRTIITQFSQLFPESAAELIRQTLSKDNSYVVQAEMITQLGKIGNSKDIPMIKEYIKPWSPRKIVRIAANNSIKSLKN